MSTTLGDIWSALAAALRAADRSAERTTDSAARATYNSLTDAGWRLVRRATTDRERLTPVGPLVGTDFAVVVVLEGSVSIVRSRGAPPSVMPSAMVRDLVIDMAGQALDDLYVGRTRP